MVKVVNVTVGLDVKPPDSEVLTDTFHGFAATAQGEG